MSLANISSIHHCAYRCRDAEQTRWFYEDILGPKLKAARNQFAKWSSRTREQKEKIFGSEELDRREVSKWL